MSEGDVITQVQTRSMDEYAAVAELPETIVLNMRGKRFEVKRERSLTLPESILFSLSTGMSVRPFYDSNEEESDSDIINVDFDPDCFQYIFSTLDKASQNISTMPLSDFKVNNKSIPFKDGEHEVTSKDSQSNLNQDDYEGDNESVESIHWLPLSPHEIPYVSQSRPALIVLREDLEYYVVRDPKMPADDDIEVKDLVGEALSSGPNIEYVFDGLKNASILDSPEYHLKQMLVLSGLDPEQKWHYRKRTPYTSHMLSLEMVPIKLPKSLEMTETVYSLQKLLLFWRKPAKKCWWDKFEMNVGPTKNSSDHTPEKVRVHVRRVWTLELSIVGLEE